MPIPFEVFLSYAHDDEEWRKKLEKYLSTLLRQGYIHSWHNRDILAGSEWEHESMTHLNSAHIILLLISQDFIASDFCWGVELQQAMERHNSGTARVIPIIIRPTDLQNTPFVKLQCLPEDGKPLSTWANEDEGLLQVAQGLRRVVEQMNALDTSTLFAHRESQGQGAAYDAEELERAYCEKLRDNDEITQLQMFNRSEPLPIEHIYIKVRLQTNPRPRALPEQDKHSQQSTYDSQAVVQQGWEEQEKRAGMGTSLDPAIALKKWRRCVIVGNPGSGKTTLLKRLTLQASAGELAGLPSLPLYIKLQGVASLATIDLFDVAVKNVCDYGFAEDVVKLWLEERLNAGKVLVLFDAIDETVVGDTLVEGEASYLRVVEAIQGFKKRFHKVPLVVTVRKAAYFYRPQLTGFTELGVLDFQMQEVEAFIRNWFDYYGRGLRSADANRLIKELRMKPRLATLAKNPLLLTLIVTTYEDYNQELPDSRAELYKQCVDTLLVRWNTTQRRAQHPRLLGIDQHKALLTRIAWHLHSQGLRYDSRDNLVQLIVDFLDGIDRPTTMAAEVLSELAMHNDSFLREQAHGIYGFLHMTLQEYLAAQYVGNKLDELLPHLANPWWEEVIVLCVGSVQDAAPLLVHLLTVTGDGEIPEDLFASKLILAGRCLAARPNINKGQRDHLRTEIREQLFSLLEATPYSFIRQQVALVLAEIARSEDAGRKSQPDSVTQRLLSLTDWTKSSTLEISSSVLSALSQFGSPDVMSTLFQRYIDNPYFDSAIESALAELLSQFGDAKMSARLLPFIDKTFKSYIEVFTHLLGSIGDVSVTPTLLSLIHDNTEDIKVRYECILCFCYLKDPRAIPDLLALIQECTDKWWLAIAALTALRAIANPSVVLPLLSLLPDTNVPIVVRQNITTVLDVLGDESIIDKLMQFLHDTTIELEIRARIASTIVLHSHHRFDRELLDMLVDETTDIWIRRTIAWAFGMRSDSSLIPALRPLRSRIDIHVDVHRAIIFTLVMLGDASVVTEFISLFIPDNSSGAIAITTEFNTLIAEYVIYGDILSVIYSKLVAIADNDFLIRLIENRNLASYYREMLIQALADTERHSLVPELLSLLTDRSVVQEVRIALLSALEKLITDHEGVEQLLELWPHNLRLDPPVADAAIRVLWSTSRRTGVRIVEDGLFALRAIHLE